VSSKLKAIDITSPAWTKNVNQVIAKVNNGELQPYWRQRASAIVVDQNGKMITVQERNGKWSLPGGKIESGDTAINTIIRELKEETDVGTIRYERIGKYRDSAPMLTDQGGMLWKDGKPVYNEHTVYLVKVSRSTQPKAKGEIRSVDRVDFTDLRNQSYLKSQSIFGKDTDTFVNPILNMVSEQRMREFVASKSGREYRAGDKITAKEVIGDAYPNANKKTVGILEEFSNMSGVQFNELASKGGVAKQSKESSLKNINDVAKGDKPSATVEGLYFEKAYAKLRGLDWEPLFEDSNYYIVFKRENAIKIKDKIANIRNKYGKEYGYEGMADNPAYHTEIGDLLGYSKEDIAYFVRKSGGYKKLMDQIKSDVVKAKADVAGKRTGKVGEYEIKDDMQPELPYRLRVRPELKGLQIVGVMKRNTSANLNWQRSCHRKRSLVSWNRNLKRK
jgi:8-oxo-dGTP pyrophosphatase MutT (NUDIX family)